MKIPNISLNKYGYEGTIELQAWDEFLSDLNGVYDLDISCNMGEDDQIITQEQIAAYNYVIENQNNIRDSIITGLMKAYPEMQSEYDFDEDEAEELMPDIRDREDFKKLIGLYRVHILNVFKNGIAYTGYEFDCSWEEEHGLGVMMYQDKIVEIGGVDASFLAWIAEADAGK